MKIENVEKLVKKALQRNKDTRSNDHKLYIEVAYIINPALANVNFKMNFENAKEVGLPPFESVSRARRKLQEKYPELRPEKITQYVRNLKQIEFEDYSKK